MSFRVVYVNIDFSDGQVVVELSGGLAKQEFEASILQALNGLTVSPLSSNIGPSSLSASHLASTATNPSLDGDQMDVAQDENNVDVDVPTENTSTTMSPNASSDVQNLFQDRRRRLGAEKQEKEDDEKAKRKAKTESSQQAIEVAPGSVKAKQADYAQQRRKRLLEQKLEHERIMRQIIDDKNARKENEARRKALAKAKAEAYDGADGLIDQQLSDEVHKANTIILGTCALQVRLFDGSTVRKGFMPHDTLRTHVRAWIDEQGPDGDLPYTLKQILTPLPNRTFNISAEDESLASLGLTPNATLVKVPVPGYTLAYTANQGLISRGVSAGYNAILVGVNLITGIIGTTLGIGQPTPPAAVGSGEGAVTREPHATKVGVHVNSLQTPQEHRHQHQLYNGNQVCNLSRFYMRIRARLNPIAQLRTPEG